MSARRCSATVENKHVTIFVTTQMRMKEESARRDLDGDLEDKQRQLNEGWTSVLIGGHRIVFVVIVCL